MSGVRLFYLNFSLKIKELKENISEKYFKNLLLNTSKNKLQPTTSPEFLEWFVGFTDAEGCFSIRKPNGNSVSLIFTIELHKDDVEVLHKIANALGVGRVLVNKNKDSALFFISKFEDITSVLIPLFKKFPLQTTKYLDFLSFAKAASIILNSKKLKKKYLSFRGVEKLINLKQSIRGTPLKD